MKVISLESDQADVRNVSERYIAKSNPWIVMVSTPNAPGQLFETIERKKLFVSPYIFRLYIWPRQDIQSKGNCNS